MLNTPQLDAVSLGRSNDLTSFTFKVKYFTGLHCYQADFL